MNATRVVLLMLLDTNPKGSRKREQSFTGDLDDNSLKPQPDRGPSLVNAMHNAGLVPESILSFYF